MRPLALPALLLSTVLPAQEPYFPPTVGMDWETVEPAALGWCTDSIAPLLQLLEGNGTKAFILLKDGRIAMEHYFGTFTADSSWYWASAGKSLTAFLVGMAQAEGQLDIDQPTSTYLGPGWTALSPGQEAAITVRHQLTMTTGLDDSGDLDCTDPACLTHLAAPGTRWSYHNAPYTLLDGVLEAATGQGLNTYIFSRLTGQTGIAGLYLSVGYNNVFFSRARSAARFGLLAMHQGTWNGTDILGDPAYFTAMTTPSQPMNPAYGHLWWLNGTDGFMVPGLQLLFPGPFMPHAPLGSYHAMGKNGQFINVVPDQGLVLVRMGNAPGDGALVPFLFNDAIWEKLNAVLCAPTAVFETEGPGMRIFPNPAAHRLAIVLRDGRPGTITVQDITGRTVLTAPVGGERTVLDVSALPPGLCTVVFRDGTVVWTARFIKG
ncbi:MAG: serine hydrolase [Flavobacteriales bacterium]|jgi:CubicO group peptidase (beta-lactamase class C family)|nr:serine hydrolase [Flavobacteriales bacterium]